MLTFAGIVVIVFGVLQIILFFKIWKMTGNVAKITKQVVFPHNKEESYFEEKYSRFLFLVYNNYMDEAERLLHEIIWNDRNMCLLCRAATEDNFAYYYEKLKEVYQSWFKKLGKDFPSYENIKKDILNKTA